jgi:type II secretory pathway component HofQ
VASSCPHEKCPHEKRKIERRLLMIGSGNSQKGTDVVRRVALVALVVGALANIPTAPAEASTGIYSGSPIDLDLVDANLQDVLATFSDVTDLVFAMDAQTAQAGALGLQVSVQYESVPWDRALDEILTEAGLEWKLEGKVLWIYRPAYPPTGDRNFTGDPINLRLGDAKLVDVLDTMSKISGLEIGFDPTLETTVSVRLLGVPWDQVLDLILRISGFAHAQDGDVLEVVRVSDAKGLQLGVTNPTHPPSNQ